MPSAVSHLSLYHFRNYLQLDLPLESGPVVLAGANGAGKTNILEAISLFSPGRGLRGDKLTDMVLHGHEADPLLWAATISLDETIKLSTGLEKTVQNTEKRIHKIQQEHVKSQAAFTEWLNVVWLTPETDRIFVESPATRRRFVDHLIYAEDPLHAERLHRYEHAMRERLLVLKQGGDPLWLNPLEEQMATNGVAVVAARRQLMQKLNQGQDYQDLLFPRFESSMLGQVDEWIKEDYATNVETKWLDELKRNRSIDRESGSTKLGPHRSDWQMIHQGKNTVANQCSTGEQKIILLASILSFIQQRVRQDERLTLLLLDDVIAHLDFQHRMVLFDQICALQNNEQEIEYKGSVHTWITGTDLGLFEPLSGKAQFFTVNNATLFPG